MELFRQGVEWIILLIEGVGVAIIVVGAVIAAIRFAHQHAATDAYQGFRAALGRAILLGLEFLVAADIIRTVAVEPSFEGLALLAGIIAIRTFLSFSLEVEITGRWPWQQASNQPRPPAD